MTRRERKHVKSNELTALPMKPSGRIIIVNINIHLVCSRFSNETKMPDVMCHTCGIFCWVIILSSLVSPRSLCLKNSEIISYSQLLYSCQWKKLLDYFINCLLFCMFGGKLLIFKRHVIFVTSFDYSFLNERPFLIFLKETSGGKI